MDKPQSATFTVSANTPEELAAMLRRIADALDAGADVAAASPVPASGPGRGRRAPVDLSWWARHGIAFLDGVTPEARRAILYVAHHAPVVPIADVTRHLGLSPGPQMAGTLASIGYACKRMDAPERPFTRHAVRDQYEIDPELAELLVQLDAHETAARPRAAAEEQASPKG